MAFLLPARAVPIASLALAAYALFCVRRADRRVTTTLSAFDADLTRTHTTIEERASGQKMLARDIAVLDHRIKNLYSLIDRGAPDPVKVIRFRPARRLDA